MPRWWLLLFVALACWPAGSGDAQTRGQAIGADGRKDSEPTDTAAFMLPAPPRSATGSGISPTAPVSDYPDQFRRESALFLQTLIGRWSHKNARSLLGEPSRRRAAADDTANGPEGGHILAFPDPTQRYRKLELDFHPVAGTLRAVFAYPANLAWRDCRRIWGMDFTATKAGKGRTFYSYTTRRLDILVDAGGRVINLGLY